MLCQKCGLPNDMCRCVDEVVIPKDLQEFLGDVAGGRHGFKLGEPWKYSDKALAVVVPIIRVNAPKRAYKTMYEVLKDVGMKDTGHINKVELQNKSGGPVFVRAGTIFTGATQNRAAENSKVVKEGKAELPVRCVNQTHGISGGAGMKYGDIAPMNVTMNLISRAGQTAVWDSVRDYTSGHREYSCSSSREENSECHYGGGSYFGGVSYQLSSNTPRRGSRGGINYQGYEGCFGENTSPFETFVGLSGVSSGTSDLLGYMKSVDSGRDVINDMLQKVPLFKEQVGAIVFNPVGVVAVETFDHPKSWESIKKEVIEKYGDKVTQEQAEHLFELKPEMILPAFKKFVDGLKKHEEHQVYKDEMSETRVVIGTGLIGEYTLVKDRVIHAILVREEEN